MARIYAFIAGAALCLSSLGTAAALDVTEITQLIRNGVQESVIVNMAQSQKLNQPLSAQDVIALSAAGASPTLLEQLTRAGVVSPSYAPPVMTSSPTIVTSAPQVTYAPPAVVQPAPSVVVTSPPPVYYNNACPPTYYYAQPPSYYYPAYRPYPRRPPIYFNFSYGGGYHRPYHRWRR